MLPRWISRRIAAAERRVSEQLPDGFAVHYSAAPLDGDESSQAGQDPTESFRRVGMSVEQARAALSSWAALGQAAILAGDEIELDYDKPCMICRERPRLVPVYGGGQVCEGCARGIPIDMLPAGWRYWP